MQMYPSEFHILPQWIIYEKTRMSQKINLHEATITLESVLESFNFLLRSVEDIHVYCGFYQYTHFIYTLRQSVKSLSIISHPKQNKN